MILLIFGSIYGVVRLVGFRSVGVGEAMFVVKPLEGSISGQII